jgi:hypothetical protein
VFAFLVFLFIYLITERAWHEASREKSDADVGRKS